MSMRTNPRGLHLKDNQESVMQKQNETEMQSSVNIQLTEVRQVRTQSCFSRKLFGVKRYRLDSESGFTLTEVLAAIAVSTILIAMAAVAIFTFYTKYRELRLFAELQQDAFDAVETIKYGYPFDIEYDYFFMGIANSRSVTFEASGAQLGEYTGILCYPSDNRTGGTHDYVRFFYDRDRRAIRVQSLQGIRFFQDQIFPRPRDTNTEVTKLRFASLTGVENPRVVSMELEARVKVSEDRYRYVNYRTNIALGR